MMKPDLKHVDLKPITHKAEWEALMQSAPDAHILQSWAWGDFKQVMTGWMAHRWAFYDEAGELVALVSMGVRKLGGILPVMYAPKAPIWVNAGRDDRRIHEAVLMRLEAEARQRRALWLKIDPDVVLARGEPGSEDDEPDSRGIGFEALLRARGWRFSANQVQFRHTIQVDLTCDENAILGAMSQNTRRKIRQADKKGVRVRIAGVEDMDLLYDMYQETGERDGFLIRPRAYYVTLWRAFMEEHLAHSLIAEVDGRAIAHVVLFHYGRTCWYFYGASTQTDRDKMPNYALQWEAMRWAKARGYAIYDMWGAPDVFDESDGMWGVYGFKRGFRGVVVRHVGAWDYAPYALPYWLYEGAIPAIRRVLGGVLR